MEGVRKLLIYCLGSLENPSHRLKEKTLWQLAFSEILLELLPLQLEGPPECCDPGFTDLDKEVLESLGYLVRNAV
jgi:hypothetical protein